MFGKVREIVIFEEGDGEKSFEVVVEEVVVVAVDLGLVVLTVRLEQ